MYPEYFGMKEPSFSITPDPHYLYLSREHREALAHLLYGTGDSGGFVLLTGEVGTGKTTVCRAFLEQLPEQVDVALILNPALTAPELLHTVCVELGIEVPEETGSSKLLVDRLNTYLLEAHARGRRPVLMIDEAQNLSPEVLEQVRLLTNLETAKHKLLQIFLVGQPELRDLVRRPGLRQLAQRITARYHLTPLNAAETAEYIRHRLAVAGVDRPLFTPAAMRRIYRRTGGVPRLINILCDRALLGGYATRSQVIDAAIVSRAARELEGERGGGDRRMRRIAVAALGLLLGAGLVAYAWIERADLPASAAVTDSATPPPLPRTGAPVPEQVAPPGQPADTPPPVTAPPGTEPAAARQPGPAETAAAPEEDPATATDVAEKPAPTLPGFDELVTDRRNALALLLRHWSVKLPEDFAGDPCDYALSQGLECRPGRGTWNNLRFYDRPALVELRLRDGRSGHVLVRGLDTERVSLEGATAEARYRLSRVDPFWFGDFLVIWRPTPGGARLIGPNASPENTRWLRRTLARVPGSSLAAGRSALFDEPLRQALQRFQRRLGLEPDGIAGPETLIQLNTAANLPGIPRLEASP